MTFETWKYSFQTEKFVFTFLWCCVLFPIISAFDNPYRHAQVLDPDGKYLLEWFVDLEERKVTFNVTVATTGFVGLGFNRRGVMADADLVIGGVLPNGRPYFSDRHVIGRQLIRDRSQDYTLLEARETANQTYLSFSRAFDTCDENDREFQVMGDLISVLWAYGEDDKIGYHFQHRGSVDIYLTDPDLVPRGLEAAPPFGNFVDGDVARLGEWNVWTLSKGTVSIPLQDTAYICTFHKVPRHNRKLHGIGFRTVLEGAVGNVHHLVLHRCRPPPNVGADQFFGRWANSQGEECYKLDEPSTLSDVPNIYCQEFVHGWGVGGKPHFYPAHAGMPMTDPADSLDEYYMLQVHYDNPDGLIGLEVKFALEIFYTEELREHDAGLIALGTTVPGSPTIVIPPSSINHTIVGICGADCTNHIFPREGINIFSAVQHTHLAGRGIRTKHIRGRQELPWILHDDNYNFNYQQVRTLHTERKVMPGDELITRSTYETTDRNGSVTVGGFRTRNEMNVVLINYWPYIRTGAHGLCASTMKSEVYHDFLGIRNTTWVPRLPRHQKYDLV